MPKRFTRSGQANYLGHFKYSIPCQDLHSSTRRNATKKSCKTASEANRQGKIFEFSKVLCGKLNPPYFPPSILGGGRGVFMYINKKLYLLGDSGDSISRPLPSSLLESRSQGPSWLSARLNAPTARALLIKAVKRRGGGTGASLTPTLRKVSASMALRSAAEPRISRMPGLLAFFRHSGPIRDRVA